MPAGLGFSDILPGLFSPNHASMCIISDRHAGIDAAFNDLPELQSPRVKRRYCLRHIRSNVITKCRRNRRLRSLVWEAGVAVTENKFLEHMQTIKQNWPSAYNYLARINVERWTLSHDDGHRYGIMTTNSSESFNNSLKGCRMLLVTAIARMTFHKLRIMFANRRTSGEVMHGRGLHFTTKICEDLSAREAESASASIERYNDRIRIYGVALNTGYMLQSQQNHVQVNLTDRTCQCGMWNVNGIPCAHVIAACNFLREGYYSFVPEMYSVQNYMNSYAADFYPVDEESQWAAHVKCLPPKPATLQRSQRGQ
ncbi:uncharacterized protein LOC116027092 [Ipomoea triloba]|uniref:uncharacterized protein LOC116027092 n=1 Tax=Ipomoea triloba TaxID=35885 RepID=UPI00125D24AB|nr:uncharacterized protein LOC116027092 [Ipomoea triloba]